MQYLTLCKIKFSSEWVIFSPIIVEMLETSDCKRDFTVKDLPQYYVMVKIWFCCLGKVGESEKEKTVDQPCGKIKNTVLSRFKTLF